jgi:hypothetical protein
VEIAAPLEAVWKALTDADELVKWFSLEARVQPGAGGSIWVCWQPGEEGEAWIDIWEPLRHLRTIQGPDAGGDTAAVSPDASAEVESNTEAPGTSGATDLAGADSGTAAPVPVATDYHLEGRGGRSVLRLVQSGFSTDAEWDEFYDAVNRDWPVFLRILRHYLELHRGQPCTQVALRVPLTVSRPEAWARLFSGAGLTGEGPLDRLREGEPFAARTADGEALRGRIVAVDAPRNFALTLETFHDALLWISLTDMGGPEVAFTLLTYGLPQAVIDGAREQWSVRLQTLFAPAV